MHDFNVVDPYRAPARTVTWALLPPRATWVRRDWPWTMLNTTLIFIVVAVVVVVAVPASDFFDSLISCGLSRKKPVFMLECTVLIIRIPVNKKLRARNKRVTWGRGTQ